MKNKWKLNFFNSIFRILLNLLDFIRNKLPSLYKVSESIAILDLLISFSTLVTIENNYIRPGNFSEMIWLKKEKEFSNNGPIAIKNGRDPIMEKKLDEGYFISV